MRKAAGALLILILIGCGLFFIKRECRTDFEICLSTDRMRKEWEDVRTLVLDGQFFSGGEIRHLKECGVEVYSYLNVGSLEKFRSYYSDYEPLTTEDYENWEDERWVDVTRPEWRAFITGTLAKELSDKGADGFFVDNCDVYREDSPEEVYLALVDILCVLRADGKKVIVNGGDVFLREYAERNESLLEILTGVNQETVFTSIDFERGAFGKQSDETREYYLEHLERCRKKGAEIFLTEYTNDPALRKEAENFCKKHVYRLYVSDSVELD